MALLARALLSTGIRRRSLRSRRYMSSGGTYYDSQSGMHIPIHDEGKISVYLHHRQQSDRNNKSCLEDAMATISTASALKMAGVILSNTCIVDGTIRGEGVLLELSESLEAARTLFLPYSFLKDDNIIKTGSVPDNVNLMFEYSKNNDAIPTESIKQATRGNNTSIALSDTCLYEEEDPVLVAAGIASLIDKTGGGDSILLTPNEDVGDDEMVQVCEELSYLDVIGPTIKSRLMVSAMTDDQVEECLNIGVSKYIVDDVSALDRLRAVVEEQSKELILG